MRLAEQWNAIEQALDPRWHDARLDLRVRDDAQRNRAAALLGPAGPGRMGASIRFESTRGGTGVGPEAIRRMLRRIDSERIAGTLTLVGSSDALSRPGGGNLIGRTPLVVVDVAAGFFPLRVGDAVRFERIDERRYRELEGERLESAERGVRSAE